jgi:phosphoribosylaminoimidazole-succinocarboxamide synthase|tara:strand:+ start:1518 stop:2237 length:720 start_codon:yes stop_codon:yes gene_type:complete
MEKVKEIAAGKAKSMFTTNNPDELVMEFRDDASAFDGKKRASLAGKGAVNNQFNAFIMNYLGNNGIEHHLIDLIDNTHSLVRSLDMFPIECVIRNRATGSICKRLGTKDGLILKKPLFEFFLKDDDLGDPLINRNHIVSFGWAKDDQLDEMIKISHEVNDLLTKLFSNSGMILVDFKLEFGVSNNKILLGDEFTPDGCRLWDDQTLEKLDKDRFRQDLGDVIESYHMVAHRLGMQIKVD